MLATISSVLSTLSFGTICLVLVGVVLGIAVGSIPGLTATMAVAVLTSFTFGMESGSAIAMLLGIFVGGVYGGSISAILMKIPGTSSAVMTALDGYPMSCRGEGGKAIGISTVSSFFGGIVSCIFLILGCSAIARIAAKFTYPEYFVIAVFGLCVIANASADSLLKGLLGAIIGVFITTIGMDNLTGIPRFTFGSQNLMSGIGMVPALIGLFGVSEIMNQLFTIDSEKKQQQKIDRIFPGWEVLGKLKGVLLRCSIIGTIIGALPGAGGPIAAFVAYNSEKSNSKHPEKFGTGIPEGIAAPECANNATVGGALIPMLALGVPGDAVTAIILGAFAIHGIRLGPMIFQETPEVVYSVYVYTIIANIFMIIIGLLAARWFAKLINTDKKILMPLILMACVIGSSASSNKVFDIYVMVIFGILGFFMDKVGISTSALILGQVLGALAETNFRSALTMSQGNYAIFFRPIPCVFWALTIAMVVVPKTRKVIKTRKSNKSKKEEAE